MTEHIEFAGFPRECISFLSSLKENNNKSWFDAHRNEYELRFMEPARSFVTAMGEELKHLVPGIHADPRSNKSIFRIYRDTRFSKDKRPYKTHMAVFFWEGSGPKMECPGFYFHFDNTQLLLGVGIYLFPKHMLHAYRQSVVHARHGKELETLLDDIRIRRDYSIGGKHYKRAPRGYDADHERAELLLYNGLYIGRTEPIPEILFSVNLIDHCLDVYSVLLPVHQWLVALVQRTTLHGSDS
jgi:uncharacterized protein (TIGR02453 family)